MLLVVSALALCVVRLVPPLRMVEAAPSAPPPEAAPVQSSDPREAWARDLLARLGNGQPTAETVRFVLEWMNAEDTSNGALARFNPLNTTQSGFSETMTINGDGVKGYASYEDGLNATVQTLSYAPYSEIVAGLQTNDPERAYRGLISSPWASSHYNWGWR